MLAGHPVDLRAGRLLPAASTRVLSDHLRPAGEEGVVGGHHRTPNDAIAGLPPSAPADHDRRARLPGEVGQRAEAGEPQSTG